MESLYLTSRFALLISCNILLFILGYPYPELFMPAKLTFVGILSLVFIDYLLLYLTRKGIAVRREHAEKLSNGDENPFFIHIESRFRLPIKATVIDELPFQLQVRNFEKSVNLKPGERKMFSYMIKPNQRGEYKFGFVNVFVRTVFGLCERRYKLLKPKTVPVFPSYMQLRKYEFLAISNRLEDVGIKKLRRVGQNTEFDQIREYVRGDDIRNINWKATARKGSPMVNQYQDEKSQQIICAVDKGRTMKMPFNELSLLDHAINSSLVFSNIAIRKDDRAGLITFSNRLDTFLHPSKRNNQMQRIQNALYKQETSYKESDYLKLYQSINWHLTQRSLIVLFTNFESLAGLNRQLKYLKRISQDHLLLTVFFENTELKKLTKQRPESTLDVYTQTIAEKFDFEKRLIAKELRKNGIHSILTTPENLTVNVINKYLEFKSRSMI